MTIHIGEISSQVELTGRPEPPERPPGPPPAAQPGWAERARHRALCRALDRDTARTCVEDPHA
jgi:hypothetical protein